jgi:hypothetical protein
MTDDEMQKLARRSFESILNLAKLYNYAGLMLADKKFVDFVTAVYQQGIKDFHTFTEEVKNNG